jgi:hypothetical protein
MLVTFELLGHPGGDLFPKIDYVRWIRRYVEIHGSLLSSFAVPGFELKVSGWRTNTKLEIQNTKRI